MITVLVISNYTRQHARLAKELAALSPTVKYRSATSYKDMEHLLRTMAPDVVVMTPFVRNHLHTCDALRLLRKEAMPNEGVIIVNSHDTRNFEIYRMNGANIVIRPRELKKVLKSTITELAASSTSRTSPAL